MHFTARTAPKVKAIVGEEMNKKLKTLALLYRVLGGFCALNTVAVDLRIHMAQQALGFEPHYSLTRALLISVGGAFSAILLFAAHVISRRKAWRFCRIASVIACFAFPPLGTVLGIHSFRILGLDHVKGTFPNK